MNKIRTIIIDDESMNRDLISVLVHRLNPDFSILGGAENIENGYELINKEQPDLVFLDIKMPGGTGFDLLKKIGYPKFEVVFITAFDEYAVKAFEFNAIDYLLKPIDQERMEITLKKVQSKINDKLKLQANTLENFASSYNNGSFIISKIPVHHKDQVILLNVNEIVSIQSENGYTVFSVQNSSKFVSSKQLNCFEFMLEPHEIFLKVNKGVFINLNYVKSYSKGQTCIISLINNCTYEVSRRKKTEILAILNKYMKI